MSNHDALREKYGLWKSYPKYPVEDWQHDVANGDTRMGYWPWVSAKIDTEGD